MTLACRLTLKRVVSFEEGKALADSWGCEFFETSAKHNENIGRCLFFLRLNCLQ